MPNVLDGCAEEGPLLTPALSKPKTITKTQVKRCFSNLLFLLRKQKLHKALWHNYVVQYY